MTMAAVTRSGVLVGTPAYMSPEQAHGSRRISTAADIFSLGCVLYECLTGQPPFIADHVAAVLARVLFEEPRPAHTFRANVPEPIDQLLMRMLIKDPAKRIADAPALLAELNQLTLQDEALPPELAQALPTLRQDDSDQILVNVVLAAPRHAMVKKHASIATLTLSDLPTSSSRQAVQAALDEMGIRAEWLLDGSVVVTLAQYGAATDQVVRAAQVALRVKRAWPEAQVVLTTGLGATRHNLMLGTAIDRAAKMLRHHDTVRNDEEASGTYRPVRTEVWVDELSGRLLERYYHLTNTDDGTLLTETVWGPDQSRLLLGKPTICVGREQELSTLEVLQKTCVEEAIAKLVVITGPAGSGKSRLRHEFLRRLNSRAEKSTVLYGRADMMSRGAPLGVIANALRARCEIVADQSLHDQQQQLAKVLGDHLTGETFAPRIIAFLGELCGIPFADENDALLRAARSDPKIMKDQIGQAFLDFIGSECSRQPVVLVLEDMHFGDSMTINLVEAALRTHSEQPLTVIVLGRPEMHDMFPKLSKALGSQEIALKGLSKKACERLIVQILGKDTRSTVIETITKLSMGHPLFLEELIRAAAEGQLDEQPATVLAILQARLWHIDPEARRVLRAASIFGQSFRRSGLLKLLGSEGADIDSWLEHLISLELIEKNTAARMSGEMEYGFRHALMSEAVYGLLTDYDRRSGHVLAGTYLAELRDSEPSIVAAHFRRGGDLLRALQYHRKAAEQCFERHDLEGVLEQTRHGLTCGAIELELGVLLAMQCVAHAWRLEWSEAAQCGEQAIALLPRGSLWWCRAIQQLFMSKTALEQSERMQQLVEEFARARPAEDALYAYSSSAAHLIVLTALMGDRDHSFPFLIFLEQVAVQKLETDLLVRAWTSYAQGWYSHALEAEPFPALTQAAESVRAFQASQADAGLCQAQVLHGLTLGYLGAISDGESDLRQALTRAQALRDPFLIRWSQVHLAQLLADFADVDMLEEACALGRQALTDQSNAMAYSIGIAALARALLRRGEVTEALSLSRVALAPGAPTVALYRLPLQAIFIECLLSQGARELAATTARQALTNLEALSGAGWCELPLRTACALALRAAGDLTAFANEAAEVHKQITRRAEHISDLEQRRRYMEVIGAPYHAALGLSNSQTEV